MRAFRAVAAAVLSAVVLAGCGPSGGGGDAPPASAGGSAGTASGPSPSGSPAPGPSATSSTSAPSAPPASSATPAPATPAVPSAGETLVRVSRSGGFAGDTHTLLVRGDGSWTRLDRRAKAEDSGKLSETQLTRLRTVLREADFPALPRMSSGGPKVFDGFTYAFVHGGVEVAAEQESLPPVLAKVLDALPPFSAG